MPTSIATRAALAAEREAMTLAMLRDRLPDVPDGRTTFADLWRSVEQVPGLVGRNDFYRLLSTLDGLHLPDEGLIVRIGQRETASRRIVLVRVSRTWDAQRAYLRRYVARGRTHPPLPITYAAAHRRVRNERGPASAHLCVGCGDPAAEWSYDGISPDEQLGAAGPVQEIHAWSPNPSDYEPRCRPCHWTFDESGVIFGVGPAPRSPVPPLRPFGPVPDDAPVWIRDLIDAADWQRMLRS